MINNSYKCPHNKNKNKKKCCTLFSSSLAFLYMCKSNLDGRAREQLQSKQSVSTLVWLIVAQTRPQKSAPSELIWSLSVNKYCYIPKCSLASLVSENSYTSVGVAYLQSYSP